MAFLKTANRAESTLDGGISDADLSLDVAVGEGALFPASGDFHITIEDEILVCTARAGDTLTVTRAAESTIAAAHLDGVAVELRITKGVLDAIEAEINAKGVAVDAIWDVAGDIVQATGADAAVKLAIGSAKEGLRVNPGATALEYVDRGWEVLSEQDLVADATTITFTGLDLDTVKMYDFHMAIQDGSGGNQRYDIYFNNDTTITNYYTQYITADGGVLASGRLNIPFVMGINANLAAAFHFTVMRCPDGTVRWLMKCGLRHTGVACGMRYYGGIWTTTGSNVTQIHFTSMSAADGFKAGSKIILFQLRQ